LQTYSQDTTSVKDTNSYDLPEIETLKPIVFKKHGEVYYGFDTKQSEYLFNSLKQRDFYFHKYKMKVEDFNNIVELYDEKLYNKDEQLNLKDSVITSKDEIIINKTNEFCDKEKIYKKQLKKEKFKTVIGTVVGVAIGVIGTLIIVAL